jgi:hypothetical protein
MSTLKDTEDVDAVDIGKAYADAVTQNVRAEVARARYTLSAIEPVIGLSHPPVQRRLSNQQEWSLSELAQIAHWLVIPVSDLTTVRP